MASFSTYADIQTTILYWLARPTDTQIQPADSITLDYIAGISALSSTNTTNWLLLTYPSLYLCGSMLWGEAFIGNDERAPGWVSLRESIFNRIIQADIKQRWTGGVLTIRTD